MCEIVLLYYTRLLVLFFLFISSSCLQSVKHSSCCTVDNTQNKVVPRAGCCRNVNIFHDKSSLKEKIFELIFMLSGYFKVFSSVTLRFRGFNACKR